MEWARLRAVCCSLTDPGLFIALPVDGELLSTAADISSRVVANRPAAQFIRRLNVRDRRLWPNNAD